MKFVLNILLLGALFMLATEGVPVPGDSDSEEDSKNSSDKEIKAEVSVSEEDSKNSADKEIGDASQSKCSEEQRERRKRNLYDSVQDCLGTLLGLHDPDGTDSSEICLIISERIAQQLKSVFR